MRKKVMLASLLAVGLAASVGTRIHAQGTAYLCGGYHSHIHSTMDGCLRTLKKRQAARGATTKHQAEATQRQAQTIQKQNASTTPAFNTTVQSEAVNTANVNSSQQPGSQTAQQVTDTVSNPCPYRGNYGGIHQHSEDCDGIHQLSENYNSGIQGYHHSGGRGQGTHHDNGNDHRGR